ncbi:hypothetical protein OCS_01715 [Ophiocordyceps sinensis CO18]|uniref:Uncharacterized protein n=1 Tax=Ophiocordyceps sinensis (strain Co18 / CGMCC 3.14243) TaxID=911162 RepID=T5ALE7_OPHSC|nr:hypothetical protein OCS_01715 [Ophiocordyceps sinensis CO18]
MDSLSSTTSNSPPSASTAPSSDSKQPCYTTAGTIYNPSSALPLQPPTRRGRSTKWNLSNPHSELSLLPKSILAGLSSKALATNPGGRSTSTLQQYTPLQQNYDRAVSPTSELEHAAFNMSLLAPHRRRPAGQGQDARLRRARQFCQWGAVPDSDDDDDDEVNMNFLKNMPVKSLNNLASYPNPTQKNAQKALLGGRFKLGGMPSPGISASHPHSLRQQAGSSSDEPNVELLATPMGLLRPAETDVSATLDHHQLSTRLLPTARSLSPVSSVEADMAPAPTTFANGNGNGTPRPLTAGPPGQRQYRPSTFESTFKALQSKHKGNGFSKEDVEGFAIAHQILAHAGIEDISSLDAELFEQPASDPPEKEQDYGDLSALVRASKPDFAPRRPCVVETAAPASPWDPSLDVSLAHWRDASPTSRERYVPGTARLTEQMIKARNERIAAHWYAGSELLGKSPEDVLHESNYRILQRSYGVIGDGRPNKPKVDYRPMEVAEASRTPVSEHTKPLLNMAFATLVHHIEYRALEGPFGQFGTPAKGLCDATPEGNGSFHRKTMKRGHFRG